MAIAIIASSFTHSATASHLLLPPAHALEHVTATGVKQNGSACITQSAVQWTVTAAMESGLEAALFSSARLLCVLEVCLHSQHCRASTVGPALSGQHCRHAHMIRRFVGVYRVWCAL